MSVTACACGTIEPFRLENTFNIIKSNSKSSTAASTTKLCPQIPQSENHQAQAGSAARAHTAREEQAAFPKHLTPQHGEVLLLLAEGGIEALV